ncbi:MAG: flavodoxin [Clostridia bacterium]|nr:flavodoxin [Clostridia bacterium]
MNSVVIYKSRYGSTQKYAQWIAEELGCSIFDAKNISSSDLIKYDTIIYGGGLYGEVICGAGLITKNIDLLKGKKIVIFSTGITPLYCREYYDKMVIEKNFKNGLPENVKVFNFLGKMILDELSFPHRTAIKALKKFMSSKDNPSDMEKLLIELCDADGDFTDKNAIFDLVEYAKAI